MSSIIKAVQDYLHSVNKKGLHMRPLWYFHLLQNVWNDEVIATQQALRKAMQPVSRKSIPLSKVCALLLFPLPRAAVQAPVWRVFCLHRAPRNQYHRWF